MVGWFGRCCTSLTVPVQCCELLLYYSRRGQLQRISAIFVLLIARSSSTSDRRCKVEKEIASTMATSRQTRTVITNPQAAAKVIHSNYCIQTRVPNSRRVVGIIRESNTREKMHIAPPRPGIATRRRETDSAPSPHRYYVRLLRLHGVTEHVGIN